MIPQMPYLITQSELSESRMVRGVPPYPRPCCLQYSLMSCRLLPRALILAVIVVGHTNCGGCVAAYGTPKPTDATLDTPLARFLDPVVRLRHSMPADTSLDDLITENVKANVRNVMDSNVSPASPNIRSLYEGDADCLGEG